MILIFIMEEIVAEIYCATHPSSHSLKCVPKIQTQANRHYLISRVKSAISLKHLSSSSWEMYLKIKT